jgi:S1-C subfamily serine protease
MSATRAQDSALADLVNSVPIREVGSHTWEVSARDAREVSSSVDQLFFEAVTSAWPRVTPGNGVAVTVHTAAGDGTLDRQGFLVENPKIASRMGLKMGDRILSVNEEPVNSLAGLYRIYQKLKSDSQLSEVKVVIARNDQPRTLTYRLR